MDFSWTQEQLDSRDAPVTFARTELNHEVAACDHEHIFPHDAWKKCGEFGLQGLPVPEEYRGQGADPLTIILAMEALGYGCRAGTTA